ncbi:hypothetical protein Q4620_001202 [Listeria monocytogenes]|nr:hypothetical protein [Listeria monocytogenes]
MRDIEYRAFVKETKKMLPVTDLCFNETESVGVSGCGNAKCTLCVDWYNFDDVVLMQYTGLKDKNGTEIFKDVGYYPTIDKALQAFVDYQIKTSEINSFEELASELNAIRELLVDIASKLEITIPSTEEDK